MGIGVTHALKTSIAIAMAFNITETRRIGAISTRGELEELVKSQAKVEISLQESKSTQL